MQTKQIIELAATIASHAHEILSPGSIISISSTEQYWAASKSRVEHWAKCLKDYRDKANGANADQKEFLWSEVKPVIEEIFISEMLTRVWGAILSAYDKKSHGDSLSQYGKSVLISQMESNNRSITILLNEDLTPADEAKKLNQLRHRVERWTDLLIASIMTHFDVSEYAIDEERAREFAKDRYTSTGRLTDESNWDVLINSLKSAFIGDLDETPTKHSFNRRIAAGVLGSFRNDVFESLGFVKSLWLLRIENSCDDAQSMLDNLIQDEYGSEIDVNEVFSSNNAHALWDRLA